MIQGYASTIRAIMPKRYSQDYRYWCVSSGLTDRLFEDISSALRGSPANPRLSTSKNIRNILGYLASHVLECEPCAEQYAKHASKKELAILRLLAN